MTVADLIIRGLSGEHLHGFLPGNDNRAAISRSVSSKHQWCGPGYWCAVTRDGFGDWGGLSFEVRIKERRSDAVLFITWAEVLAVIGHGCGGGRREAYEAAYRAWCAAAGEAREAYRAWANRKPGTGSRHCPVPFPDPRDMYRARDALIRHGCEQTEVMEALF